MSQHLQNLVCCEGFFQPPSGTPGAIFGLYLESEVTLQQLKLATIRCFREVPTLRATLDVSSRGIRMALHAFDAAAAERAFAAPQVESSDALLNRSATLHKALENELKQVSFEWHEAPLWRVRAIVREGSEACVGMTVSASHLLVDGLGCAGIARVLLHFLFDDVSEIEEAVRAGLPETVEEKTRIDVPPVALFSADASDENEAARSLFRKTREMHSVLRPHVEKLTPLREAFALETRVVDVAALLRACKRREIPIDTVLTTVGMRVCHEVLRSAASVTPVSLRKEFPDIEKSIGNYFFVVTLANPFGGDESDENEDFWAVAQRVHERKMKHLEGGKVEAYRRACASMYMPFNVLLLPALRALWETGATAALEKCTPSVPTVLASCVASTCLNNYGCLQLPHAALVAATANPFGRSLRFDFCTANDAQEMTVTVTACHEAVVSDGVGTGGSTSPDNRELAASLVHAFCRTLAHVAESA
ncbi:MAG: hypothetical protein MHM6MM_002686 [Cercozoa sp. M6MM]